MKDKILNTIISNLDNDDEVIGFFNSSKRSLYFLMLISPIIASFFLTYFIISISKKGVGIFEWQGGDFKKIKSCTFWKWEEVIHLNCELQGRKKKEFILELQTNSLHTKYTGIYSNESNLTHLNLDKETREYIDAVNL